jgi:CHAT domain-containing protein
MDITSCLAGIQRWFDNLWHSLQLPASFYAWTFVLLLLIPLQDMKARSAQAEYEHAWNLFLHGDLAKSQQEAEQGAWRFQIADPAYALKFQLLEAQSMLFRGMYEDALRVLAVLHPTSGNPNWTIQKLALEAIALSRQQQFAPASQRLKEAEALCKESAPESCGEVLRARGILAGMQGQRATARRYYLNTLVFARAHHDRWSEAGTLINLGFSALQLERYDEALDWLRAAYQIAVELGADNQLQFVAGNLGWTYYSLGDGEKALELFLEAEKSAARLGNVHMELNWVGAKGSVYRDTGDLTHAAESYRRTLDLAKQIDSKEDIVNALENLAQVLVETGKLEEASGYLNQVTFMERSYSNRLSGQVMLTQGMLATARHQDQQAETLFSAVRNDATSPTTTRLGAGNELARLFEQQGNTREAERVYKATLTAFESARAQLKNEDSRLPFAANATRIYDGYIHLLVKQGRSEEALAAADQSRAQTLAQGLGVAKTSFRPAALNPRQIAQKTGATLLFYWLGDKQSYLWAVTPAKITLIQLPAQKEIVARVERYRWALLDVEDPLQARNEDGQALYQLLVAPAAKLLRRNAPVMILSDGALSQLSFETLLAPGPSPQSDQNSSSGPAMHYLLDDATLLSAPSLAMLAAAKPARAVDRNLLLLGDPVSPNQDYPSLPLFGSEISQILKHFAAHHMAIFAGSQATPAAYLSSNPAQYSYIHFVSHAVASRTDPLDSAIILSGSTLSGSALSGGKGSETSFKLYARDIMQHPIDARLVTISACYGSGTRSYAGEGLVGLSWAFLRAGAQNVIGSLWEVSDDSTPRLMNTLYQGLEAGQAPALALRNAKLTLLHSQSKFRKPFYWAPFQIYTRQ